MRTIFLFFAFLLCAMLATAQVVTKVNANTYKITGIGKKNAWTTLKSNNPQKLEQIVASLKKKL